MYAKELDSREAFLGCLTERKRRRASFLMNGNDDLQAPPASTTAFYARVAPVSRRQTGDIQAFLATSGVYLHNGFGFVCFDTHEHRESARKTCEMFTISRRSIVFSDCTAEHAVAEICRLFGRRMTVQERVVPGEAAAQDGQAGHPLQQDQGAAGQDAAGADATATSEATAAQHPGAPVAAPASPDAVATGEEAAPADTLPGAPGAAPVAAPASPDAVPAAPHAVANGEEAAPADTLPVAPTADAAPSEEAEAAADAPSGAERRAAPVLPAEAEAGGTPEEGGGDQEGRGHQHGPASEALDHLEPSLHLQAAPPVHLPGDGQQAIDGKGECKNPIFTCISRFFLSPLSHAVEDLLASFRCQSCTELADPPSVYVCPEGHVLCGPHLEELQRVRGLPSGKVPCFSCGDDARPSVTFIRIRALEETIAACRKEKEHEDIVKLRQEVSRLRLQGRSETRIAQVTKRL